MDAKDTLIFGAIDSVEANLTKRGYSVYGTFLHGSQNYGLDLYTKEYRSDINLKCFVVPDFEALFYNRVISTTEDNGFGGHVEIKDLRLLPSLLAKGNVSYLEILYTKWAKCPDKRIVGMRDEIVRDRFPLIMRSIYGMAMNKVNDMRHPFPTKEAILNKYGYDPKQLCHLYRMLCLSRDMIDKGRTFGEALTPLEADRQYLLQLKLGAISNAKVNDLSSYWLSEIKGYMDLCGSKERCARLDSRVEDEVRAIVADVVKSSLRLK